MSARKIATQERRRAEDAVRLHLKTCLACYRWQKGQNPQSGCNLGPQLIQYLELMRRQEELIPPASEMIQDPLF